MQNTYNPVCDVTCSVPTFTKKAKHGRIITTDIANALEVNIINNVVYAVDDFIYNRTAFRSDMLSIP